MSKEELEIHNKHLWNKYGFKEDDKGNVIEIRSME